MLEVIPSTAALIVELPFATAVARPSEPEMLEMVATASRVDAQVTSFVRFWVV